MRQHIIPLVLSCIAVFLPFSSAAVLRQRQNGGSCQALVNGQATDFSWLCGMPADQRANVNIPGVIQNGVIINPADGSSGGGTGTGTGTGASNQPATSPVASPESESSNGQQDNSQQNNGQQETSPSSTSTAPASTNTGGSSGDTSGSTSTNDTNSVPDTSGHGASGCPAGLKSVTFNGGYSASMFDTIGAANSWTSFGLPISGTASSAASAAHVPMMAFASDVAAAVELVNGANAPDWMLTFNEPDYSYGGFTPTMSPQDAATAIQPLLKSPGTKTKFVAPVTADPLSDWVPQFFAACQCQSFFSAYNIHIYFPTSAQVTAQLTAFRSKYANDKPVWVTEVAPGNADPACSLSWDAVTGFMNDVYRFAKQSGWVERVFWNTGNQIGPEDHNVCNSWLLDSSGANASPLLKSYQAVDCS